MNDPGLATALLQAARAMSAWEAAAVVLGVAYLLLAMRESLWCWYAAFVSTGIFLVLFWQRGPADGVRPAGLLPGNGGVRLVAVATRRRRRRPSWPFPAGTPASTWQRLRRCCWLSAVSGALLQHYTDAALPYLDSFTTWGSILTTWMVARKILENWLYWLVIDSVSIYLYLDRGLYLTALLVRPLPGHRPVWIPQMVAALPGNIRLKLEQTLAQWRQWDCDPALPAAPRTCSVTGAGPEQFQCAGRGRAALRGAHRRHQPRGPQAQPPGRVAQPGSGPPGGAGTAAALLQPGTGQPGLRLPGAGRHDSRWLSPTSRRLLRGIHQLPARHHRLDLAERMLSYEKRLAHRDPSRARAVGALPERCHAIACQRECGPLPCGAVPPRPVAGQPPLQRRQAVRPRLGIQRDGQSLVRPGGGHRRGFTGCAGRGHPAAKPTWAGPQPPASGAWWHSSAASTVTWNYCGTWRRTTPPWLRASCRKSCELLAEHAADRR